MRYLLERLLAIFRHSRYEQDLEQELEAHTALLTDQYIRKGHFAEEALRIARIELGGRTALREAHADTRGVPWLENLRLDTLYAFRSLRRDRGFAVFALLVGSLGIGASTAIFSIVDALLVRQLPLRDPASLVWIAKNIAGAGGAQVASADRSSRTVPVNPFLEFRQQNLSFEDIAAFYAFYEPGDRKLTGAGEPERLTGVPVSYNFFRVLGVAPKLGRDLTPEECRANLPVAVLSEGFWKRRFSADPEIIGKPLTINNRVTTVVGVVPLDFGSLLAPGTRVDLFTPLPLTPEVNRMGNTLSMIGRLRTGVAIRKAQAEADVLTGPIGARNDRAGLRFSMQPLDEYVRGALRPALLLLIGAVGVVMLVLCANVSHLQLARAAAKRKEMAVRSALGAGTGRLVQQLITENLILFGAAALIGLGIAFGMTRLIAGLESIHLPLREDVRIDGLAFAFTGLVAIVTGMLCGLAPAAQLPFDVHNGLKENSRAATTGRRQGWLRRGLVVTEIAFACVLLVGSGLLLRSLQRALDFQLGFEPEHAATLRIDPSVPVGPARGAYLDDVLARVRALPGIEAAGIGDMVPMGGTRSWSVGKKEESYSEAHPPPDAMVRIITDGTWQRWAFR
jgi:predicted permease